MVTLSRRHSLVLALLWIAAPAAGDGGKVEPTPCREAIAQRPSEPVEALADAEQSKWTEARSAQRKVRKLMKGTMGLGESKRSIKAAAEADALSRRFEKLVAEAWVLCRCREARGDPNRQDCRSLYGMWVPRASREPAATE